VPSHGHGRIIAWCSHVKRKYFRVNDWSVFAIRVDETAFANQIISHLDAFRSLTNPRVILIDEVIDVVKILYQ